MLAISSGGETSRPVGAQPDREPISRAARWVGVGAFALIFSLLSLHLEASTQRLITGWPINAVFLGCLLRSPGRRWPGFGLIFIVAGLIAPMAIGKSPLVAGAVTLVNAALVLACAALLRRVLGSMIDLGRYRHLWIFSLAAGLALPLTSISLISLVQPQPQGLVEKLPSLEHWAVGSSLSYMLITPAMFAWAPARIRDLVRQRGLLRVLLVLAVYTAGVAVISIQKQEATRMLLAPALIWLTFQLGAAGVTAGLIIQATLLTTTIVAKFTPQTLVPDPAAGLSALQMSLLLSAGCAYPVAAALAERWRLSQQLANSIASLEHAQKLSQLAEQIGDVGYLHYDVATGKSELTDNLARMLRAEVGGLDHLLHPEDYERALQQKVHAIATGEDYDGLLRIRGPGGGWRTLRSRSTCLKDADDKVQAIVGVMVDVTDLELADQALRASEARYRLLADNLNDMILLTDLDNRLAYVSPAASTLTGFHPDELLGQGPENLLVRLIHPDDLAGSEARLVAMHQDAPLEDFTYRLRHRDGHWIWMETRTAVLRDSGTGQVTGGLHVVRDVSVRKAMEAELERKCREAEAANRAKSEFLANMSHEIRTPLNGVMGIAGALARTRLEGAQQEMVSLIETSAKTLETLLSDILDLARIEAGKMELRPGAFDLAASVNACASLFDAAAEAKGVKLEVAIDPAALGAYIGDAARIRQILSNLLGNAVKFTAAGRIVLTVRARSDEGASQLRFEVRDTGIGFDAETKARLFSRFEQADGSITRKFGGSGLGLAISRSLANAMGGALEADSRPGEGSVFTLTVTLAQDASRFAAADETPAGQPEADGLMGLRVLLAEDHPANRRVVELILGTAGVELTCVENGAEAVEAFRTGIFDLVLMDMQMPVMDGLTAIGEIRRLEAASGALRTPIHVLTANAMPEHINASHAAGADGHLAKPILAQALLDRVSETAIVREHSGQCALQSGAA